MKKLLLSAILMAPTAIYATETGDTLVINDAHKVTIVTNDSLQKIKVTGQGDNEDYVYENSIQLVDSNYVDEQYTTYRVLDAIGFPISRRDTTIHRRGIIVSGTMHWALGFNAGISPDINFSTFKSLEATWNILNIEVEPYWNGQKALQRYEIGLALNWRNYRFDTDHMLVKDHLENVALGSFPDGTSARKSNVNIFSLSVPVMFTQRLGRKSRYRLTLGPVINFNVSGSLTNDYTIGDYDYEETVHHIGYRPITVDLMGIIRYRWIGAYVKYSPMSVFKTGRGPKFHSLSFGLYF